MVDLDIPVTDKMQTTLPVFYYFRRYGMRIIHWWAAVLRCDISKQPCGILHVKRSAFLSALRSFVGKDAAGLNPHSFTVQLRKVAKPQCCLTYSVGEIAQELERVGRWFTTGGTFYNNAGDVCSIAGPFSRATSRATRHHMRGDLNPKTMAEFTSKEQRLIGAIQPHNLSHNSAAS